MASWATRALLLLAFAGCGSDGVVPLTEEQLQLLGEPIEGEATASEQLDRLLAAFQPNELTGRALPKADLPGPLRLQVMAHIYGSPSAGQEGSILPSPALVESTSLLRDRKPALVVSVGDFVYKYRSSNLDATIGVLKRLEAPVVNAMGNHEDKGRGSFLRNFGSTYGALRLNQNLLFFLDAELDPWNITADQLQLLERCIALAPAAGIKRLLLFSHKLIFCVGNERYGPLIGNSNAHDSWEGRSNFKSQVLPLLAAFQDDGHEVIWFGGDIGVRGTYGLFFDRDPATGITYLCTGMGEQPWDNAIEVSLPSEGQAGFLALSLAGEPLPPIEECGPEFWAARFPTWAKRQLDPRPE